MYACAKWQIGKGGAGPQRCAGAKATSGVAIGFARCLRRAGRRTECVVMSASVVSVISRFLEEYLSSTPQRLKLLDAYLLYILLTGALQFGYCLLVGTFPFNSFLSGFISCVGSFILAGNDSISNRSSNVFTLAHCFYSHSTLFCISSPPRDVMRGAALPSCEWRN